jgi:hypothetical protein
VNKYFLIFCSLLIVVWLALQWVIDERIKEQADLCATELFTWSWPTLNADSSFVGQSIKVLKRSDTEALVEVSGLQKLYKGSLKQGSNDPTARQQCDTYTVTTKLSFYKMNGRWLLGNIQL